VTTPDGASVKVWLFMPVDCPPGEELDGAWVEMVGLERSAFYRPAPHYNFNDDGGFLVRKNGVAIDDRRWWPDDPRPGDDDWSYDDYFWAFAASGFNDSAFIYGYEPDDLPEPREREIYEWELFATEPFDLNMMDAKPPMHDWKGCRGPDDPPIPGGPGWPEDLMWVDMMPVCPLP
jgi:hypothetical protein